MRTSSRVPHLCLEKLVALGSRGVECMLHEATRQFMNEITAFLHICKWKKCIFVPPRNVYLLVCMLVFLKRQTELNQNKVTSTTGFIVFLLKGFNSCFRFSIFLSLLRPFFCRLTRKNAWFEPGPGKRLHVFPINPMRWIDMSLWVANTVVLEAFNSSGHVNGQYEGRDLHRSHFSLREMRESVPLPIPPRQKVRDVILLVTNLVHVEKEMRRPSNPVLK